MVAHCLCSIEELADPGGKGFELGNAAQPVALFVVRRGAHIRAFHNRCPHTGVNLNWLPDQFLSHDDTHIQCALHGALFRIEDGHCVWGPCRGQALEAVPLMLRAGKVYVCL